jgi:radical SAM superfamily enzyme YgiQ (UPF0313 family)
LFKGDILSKEVVLILSSSSKSHRVEVRERYKFPPIGLLCLSSLIKIHGYKVAICDLAFEDFSRAGFVKHLRSLAKAPAMVGICVYTEAANESPEIASLSKQAFPEAKVVLGGPHATFCYEELLAHECVDFVVRGEGESKIIQLLEYISHPNSFPLQVIPGIAYKTEMDGGYKVQLSKPSSFITCLDILPFLDYRVWKYGNDYYPRIFSLVSSRGCPGECIFCASRAFSGSKYRFHSAEWVFSMLFYYQKLYGFRRFGLFDDTFLVNKSRCKSFCNYMIKYWLRDSRLSWTCKSRAEMIDEATVGIIRQAGCRSIHLGLESGSQDVLDSIRKGITLPQVFKALKLLKEYGLEAECSFMLGHPTDSLETIEETLLFADVIESLGIGICGMGISTPFPGTLLWKEAERLGIQIKVWDWSKYNTSTPVYETEGVKFDHLRKAMLYYQHQRHKTSNPRLSGRPQEKIDFVRENFARNLRGEDANNAHPRREN